MSTDQQAHRQPNLQDPHDAAAWLRQMWPQTRPPDGATQAFTLMFATAMQTVLDANAQWSKELHDAKNKIMEASAPPDRRKAGGK